MVGGPNDSEHHHHICPSFPLETRDLSIFSVLRRNEMRSIIVQDIIEAKTDSWKDIVFVSFVH